MAPTQQILIKNVWTWFSLHGKWPTIEACKTDTQIVANDTTICSG
jgi:hypothetical protein